MKVNPAVSIAGVIALAICTGCRQVVPDTNRNAPMAPALSAADKLHYSLHGDPLSAAALFSAFFERPPKEYLREVPAAGNHTLALHAAYFDVCRSRNVRPAGFLPREAASAFLADFKRITGFTPPSWWSDGFHDMGFDEWKAPEPKSDVRSESGVFVPKGFKARLEPNGIEGAASRECALSIIDTGGKLMTIPEGLIRASTKYSLKRTRIRLARFPDSSAGNGACLAVFDGSGDEIHLMRVMDHGALLWASRAWGHRGNGPGDGYTEVSAETYHRQSPHDTVVVFGLAATGRFAEAFDARDGTLLWRFTSNWWNVGRTDAPPN